MQLANIKIGVKLSIAFVVAALLTIVLGLVALMQLGKVTKNTEDLATNFCLAWRSVPRYAVTSMTYAGPKRDC